MIKLSSMAPQSVFELMVAILCFHFYFGEFPVRKKLKKKQKQSLWKNHRYLQVRFHLYFWDLRYSYVDELDTKCSIFFIVCIFANTMWAFCNRYQSLFIVLIITDNIISSAVCLSANNRLRITIVSNSPVNIIYVAH